MELLNGGWSSEEEEGPLVRKMKEQIDNKRLVPAR